ncbi:MAG: shikimate dehydrogenase [Deltaproteobacteria bacterium]|nr:shikimate dehydrogenase [Candidatus Anaeroferrophillacea bacterium]
MISGKTIIYGIIGNPVSHSLSPALHNEVFARAGIDAAYLPFPVSAAGLAGAMAGLRSLGIAGVNITIPHKETVLPLLDEVEETARIIGAVNTVSRRGDRLTGSNTDWLGFSRQLENHGIDPAGRRIAVFGAGGAARAVVFALGRKSGQEIMVFNRTPEKARALCAHFQPLFPASRLTGAGFDTAAAIPARTPVDLIIDTLPVAAGGIADTPVPAPTGGGWFITINYGAALSGCVPTPGRQLLDGLEMLAWQARESAGRWFPDRDGRELDRHYAAALNTLARTMRRGTR